MSERADEIRGTALGIVVENYRNSKKFRALTGAISQMRELCALLEERGYTPTVLPDPGQPDIKAAVKDWATGRTAAQGRGPAVILWSGHGVLDSWGLRLVLHDTDDAQYGDETYSANLLTEAAVRSGADQMLLLIDTCHAGAGVMESLDTAFGKLSAKNLPPGRSTWLGVLASSRPQEKAEAAGILLETLTRVLREGPGSEDYRHEWSSRNGQVSGATVIHTVLAQWPEEVGHKPVPAMFGEPRLMFDNPLRKTASEPELVEHLVQASRGAPVDDGGWFFSGRRNVLGQITEWLDARQPGLFLVTGSAGCGKSAVLGRIATLSDPVHRADILEHGALAPEDRDPGEGSVDASLHLRGYTVQQLAEAIARELDLPVPQTPAALIAEVEKKWPAACRDRLPALVLDGLDEAAPDQAYPIVEQLLAPLSRLVCVLLGSRDRPFRPQEELQEPLDEAVSRLLDVRARASDLDDETDTENDIRAYCHSRLEARELPPGDAATAAGLIADRASDHTGGFLFARMATDSVIRRFAASGSEGWNWEEAIPSSISAAFTEDLAEGLQRERDGERLPHAAQDLLTALAWSAGKGMPARGVWEAAASALASGGATYGPEDVDWLLNTYGRYVVEDTDGVQAVYRLYHREFIGHLRNTPEESGPAYRVARALVDLLREQTADATMIEAANPYLRGALAAHTAMAGGRGIALVRELVALRENLFRPDLAAALVIKSLSLSQAGRRMDALAPAREAADLYRDLADNDPAVYLPDLAMSLNNLATAQGATGDLQGALATTTEATSLRRDLAERNPAAYLPSLAGALNNLATAQGATGDRQGALATITEAADLYRDLAESNPAAYLPDLAMSLNNLATAQGATGDLQGALATITEATTLRRDLASTNPAAYLPNLAGALNNLAKFQSTTGDSQGALVTITEATGLYRDLADDNPAAYLPNLASALNNLTTTQGTLGDSHGALAASTEATTLYRDLASTNPAAYLPNLAMSLNNLANFQGTTGDLEGALATITEATTLYRDLASTDPGAYLPNLASALNNLTHVATVQDSLAAYANAERALVAHAEAARYLALRRAAFEVAQADDGIGFRTLILLAHGADTTAFHARHLLRTLSQADPANASQVSALWHDVTGAEPPLWLAIPEAAMELAVDWINCPTWADSRAFWEEHAENLCSAEVAAALEELALFTQTAEEHLRIAGEAATAGPDIAFRPYLTAELLHTWTGLSTWEESQAYLTHHAAALLHDHALERLGSRLDTADSAVHHALITLARADGVPAAYRHIEDRPSLHDRLQQLLNAPEADPDLLHAIALLELFTHQEHFTGTAHLALAGVLSGVPPQPTTWPPAEPADRNRVISEVAVLIGRHPTHAAALSALIQSLLAA
ncbi:tetratricopeptide repeat protein [Streptomyces sp. ISL-44]|uniref:caspase family protein n=1 Tax=Streptomyces sp. ISL-44 TaxID=2819184 RepID=UPI001BE74973|nr:caspase family protein [Streptomyces sp. ISL-44]MBT2540323.1 tetratricopeptide repeat protein [Streptomyces sp. ISL-44]